MAFLLLLVRSQSFYPENNSNIQVCLCAAVANTLHLAEQSILGTFQYRGYRNDRGYGYSYGGPNSKVSFHRSYQEPRKSNKKHSFEKPSQNYVELNSNSVESLDYSESQEPSLNYSLLPYGDDELEYVPPAQVIQKY